MAVFNDFRWASSVRDEGNNIAEFKKINILYGRNYSGKTTLSRIFRSLETGSISDKYSSPEFQLNLDGSAHITHNSLRGHGQSIRVFNEDFVKENLHFIVDDDSAINSFAILGEDNAKLEEEISIHETELGTEEKKSGLIGEMSKTEQIFRQAKITYGSKKSDLKGKLSDKANKVGTGIKHNKAYGDANYNVIKINTDISVVTEGSYTLCSTEQSEKHHELLKEEPKDEIVESTPFSLKYSSLVTTSRELLEKNIKASEPIKELLSDAALSTWVRNGRLHHEGKKTHCSFCGNDLPKSLWEKLDKHFNKQSEELRSAIDKQLTAIDNEKKRIPNLIKIKKTDFFSSFSVNLEELEEQFSIQSATYSDTLESIRIQLEKRKINIFAPLEFIEPTSVEKSLNSIRGSYEKFRGEFNQATSSLSDQQSQARLALRLHEVFTFITDIKYGEECEAIQNAKDMMGNAEEAKNQAYKIVKEKKEFISELKMQLKDESKGADKVNDYLNNFFGHHSLSLEAIKETDDEATKRYRFEVIRNDKKAFHLSEGECSLIAFCYFMAKLEDVDTKGSQPIIWIDDPISSLDANHIFFIYSLINAEIVSPEKYEDNGELKERERFKQLFISTHNLDFLKYLKRLPGALNKKKSQYFIINRADKSSHITLMPKYLKDYVTEFNYLFEQIYQCASIDTVNDQNYTTFYGFGNNARKFFEIYLYYKYPNQGMNVVTLGKFFGEQKVPAILTDRINNEYSHLAGVFERGSTPTEVPEMKTAAHFILQKIEEKDPDQYSALLESIGVECT
jgi:wobble nucleotide-excising tRNase